jgi:hypothetical protein
MSKVDDRTIQLKLNHVYNFVMGIHLPGKCLCENFLLNNENTRNANNKNFVNQTFKVKNLHVSFTMQWKLECFPVETRELGTKHSFNKLSILFLIERQETYFDFIISCPLFFTNSLYNILGIFPYFNTLCMKLQK